MKLQMIALGKIVDPHAPVRASIDVQGLEELADSIRTLGLIEPMVVRPEGERFEIVVGHRRLLACRMLELGEVQCLVEEEADRENTAAKRLHENLIRRDMTSIEEAVVYAELFDQMQDLEKVAAMAHRSLAVVERRLSLLSGADDVRDALQEGKISTGAAEELNKVTDQPTRSFLLRFAIQEGATVEKVRGWRQSYAQNPLQVGQEPERPVDAATGSDIPAEVNFCWLCGSDEDPHDLRVKMVHQTCERIWRRSLDDRRERVEGHVPNG